MSDDVQDPPPVLVVCCGNRLQVAIDGAVECPDCATTHWVEHGTSISPLQLSMEAPGEDYDHWVCPTCGHSVCDWCDCPECGWYNEEIWALTLEEERRLAADGGDSVCDKERWWGQPFDARRFHVFEGKGRLASTLCSAGWMLTYDGQDPDVDPENDTFKEGRDCKECSRKVGVLDD